MTTALHAAQSWTDIIAGSAQRWIVSKQLAENFKIINVMIGLDDAQVLRV